MLFKNLKIKLPGSKKKEILNDLEINILEVIKQNLVSDVISVIDVGAHLGRYALGIAAFWPEAHIYCFEPFPDILQSLKNNLKHTNHSVYNIALANENGIKEFYINNNSETNSLLKSLTTNSYIDELTKNVSSINVKAITLDSFFESECLMKVDILKIDAQGFTMDILLGAKNSLDQKKFKVIQCEVEFIKIYKNQFLFYNICMFLESCNYALYSLYNLHYDINNRLSWADALFVINDK